MNPEGRALIACGVVLAVLAVWGWLDWLICRSKIDRPVTPQREHRQVQAGLYSSKARQITAFPVERRQGPRRHDWSA